VSDLLEFFFAGRSRPKAADAHAVAGGKLLRRPAPVVNKKL
jgi:hypothetical protein